MVWWWPFGKRKQNQITLTDEQRVSKAKALEGAQNFVEKAILQLEELKLKNDKLSLDQRTGLQAIILRHLDNARTKVEEVNEQYLARYLDDASQTIRFSNSPGHHILKHQDGIINMAISTIDEDINNLNSIVEKIKARIREI